MDKDLIDICDEIFRNLISQITIHLRFMDIALDNYIYVPESVSIECDGTYLYYNPIFIIKKFKNNPNSLTHGYLHVVLHSVFRHQFLTNNYDKTLWNLACDIAVENMILELGLDCMAIEQSEEIEKEIKKLKDHINLLTAQKVYHYLKDELNKDQIALLADLFYFDDHSRWYTFRKVNSTRENVYGDDKKDDPTNRGQHHFANASHDAPDNPESKEDTKEDERANEKDIEEIKKKIREWQEISEKIETDLETFNRDYLDQTSTMVQSLERLHREKYNYTAFLKKFMSNGEKQMINADEFDFIFYTYGLRLYKNMPLIESLEYQETKSIKEFVIVIDTSGSVSGPIVQSFLQKTYNIFQQRENFFNHFNIHILQCDIKVQHDAKITTMEEFEYYINHIEIYGLGGTDFRAAFNYVDELVEKREFEDLQGLIYFTDGDGIYPKKMPNYTTAFVFLDNEDASRSKVPVWAIKYILDDDELIEE